MTASDARPPSDVCECPPCPGRGNDGHGLTHCAECCFGTGVEADIDCPVHGDARPPSDTGARVCGAQYGRNEDLCYYPAGHKGPHTNRYGCTLGRCSRRPGAAMTDRCGCVLPFYLTDDPVQCACGRWHAATTFHDPELGHVWRGWDVMPDPRSTT